ncbi:MULTISPECIES: alanine/glycine:cation symporter family protein [Pseudoalteromonas]|jgi:AGCS family alanine or glycine:cation symporter|uniref:Alanine:cation symporter family protein n=2 Tax=Pseudoalteromonas TaxID=53246 RepID=A0AAD0TXR9_9GAMM|nr:MULTISPECIES: sodium:alanine symporter family protein [Pseudoalteromonas]MDC9523207.1 sodium:alanine symporter family protein [Pseudoalteromonas sp. Angola-31]MDY6887857.1 sodium:alanine symporter family protein [Pseudomonadota bacterium]AYM86287.1 alanine:cation symporter family protein [Pseudoalteromonas agarivorans]ETJ46849.1 sodium:alanine symporter [Pseudoalteromonas agarivorans]KPV89943.1 Amino-acid carrier protein AlsT [Pseudoalteromonas sp. P1-30]|tara:strand:- start:2346 stop:3761 length:1416 start_codon:yes stop_codon:yes gene_type:complete
MTDIINSISALLWGQVLVYLLIAAGVFFTIRLGFIQFVQFPHMFKVMFGSRKCGGDEISSFQAFCTSLAARVGTGNMAGVAVALYLGGPGAIFWMWLIALIGMATSFAESTLAQAYKTKDADGNFRGGPAYYMERGLGKRWMGVLFSLCLILAFGLVFNAVQSNSIAAAFEVAFDVPKYIVGIALVIGSGIIIFGGLKTISRFAEMVVPFMALAYLLVAIYVCAINFTALPDVIVLIIKSAFGLEQAGAGAIGYGVTQAMIQGIKRGLFSNEAGMGSAANAAATATPYPPHPASQGYVQMLGVFIDTIVICTATASLILLSNQLVPESGVLGIELTQAALQEHVGDWGTYFIAIAILFFAFTSIVANYSYAETNLMFLEHNSTKGMFIFRLLVLGMVMFGAIGELGIIWTLADISMGLMAIVNVVALFMLSGVVVWLSKDYNAQNKQGVLPTFDKDKHPKLAKEVDPNAWK